MREVLESLLERWQTGESVGLASVVDTFHSAPREPGASMLVCSDGSAVGSVSGGCVESAVYELATAVIAGEDPSLTRFGVSDQDAFEVGLTCGGIIDVFVERVDACSFPDLDRVAADVFDGRPVALATVVDHPVRNLVGRRLVIRPEAVTGDLGTPQLTRAIVDSARALLLAGQSRSLTVGPAGESQGDEVRVFVTSFAPPPRLMIFGAIDFASALATAGAFLGYRVTVCDARPIFATASRFPAAEEVVVSWPHRYLAAEVLAGKVNGRTAVCVLTHDEKFDVPLLDVALRLPDVGFVGAMGSRRTHERRVAALQDRGLPSAALARLSSPIGLDLGGRTPEETAVSIVSELIARKWGGSGQRLADTSGSVHRTAPEQRVVAPPAGTAYGRTHGAATQPLALRRGCW